MRISDWSSDVCSSDLVGGENQIERRRDGEGPGGGASDGAAPGLFPPFLYEGRQGRDIGQGRLAAHDRAEHAVDKLARTAVDQRKHRRDGGVVRRSHHQRLDESDAQGDARLGVVGQALPGGAVDQRGEIGEAAQRTGGDGRSEEHTSELQSLMRISYAVFCLKKKKK